MLYLVVVDMTKALEILKLANIKVHNKLEVALHVKAKDPDDACAYAIDKIYTDIVESRNSNSVKEIAKRVKKVISIKKIRKVNPKKGK